MDQGFISRLFGGMPPHLYVCVWTHPDLRSAWFRNTADADAYARMRGASYDTYVGMGLHREDRGKSVRGRADQVAALAGVWAEIDTQSPVHKKENLPPDVTAVWEILDGLPEPPSLVVDSGHGLHVYWLFDALWEFTTPEDRRRAAGLVAGWQALLKARLAAQGWEMDATHDLARVLRVAGTQNFKERETGSVLPVQVVYDSGRTVTPEALEVHARAWGAASLAARMVDAPVLIGGGECAPPAGRFSTGMATSVALVLRSDASVPHERVQVLKDNAPRFEKTLHRKRTDLRDQSPSAYDYALASMAMRAGWGDQDVADLLISTRRTHGDDLRLGSDYYVRTLHNVRASLASEMAVEALTQGRALDEDARSSTRAGQPGAADQAADVLAAVSQFLGVPVTRFIQHGADRAQYALEIEGREVHIGQHKDVLNTDTVRGRLMDARGVVMPLIKRQAWLDVVRQLMSVRVFVADDEGDRVTETRAWVAGHANGVAYINDAADLGEVVGQNQPFVREGWLHVHAGSLRRHLLMRLMEKVDMAELRDRLRAAGFEPRKVSARVDGQVVNHHYWRAALATLEPSDGPPASLVNGTTSV